MSQRRMFSPKIVSSDAFLDMPTSSRELYFQLGMFADDDGFINPRKIMRMVGASDDDLKVLISKRFVIPFENGVVVIKHWKINNLIKPDRYQSTVYLEEKKRLRLKENGAYTERFQNGSKMVPQVRLGKDRLLQVNTGKVIISPEANEENQLFKIFYETINPNINYSHKGNRNDAKWLINKYGLEKVLSAAKYAISVQGKQYAPTITTPSQLKNKMSELIIYQKKQQDGAKIINLNNL